jgi:hypothetical protein
MKYTKNSSQVLAWKPTPYKIPEEERSLEKVGNLLSINPEEIMGISICPKYNKTQLRKINRKHRENKKELKVDKNGYKLGSKKSKKSKYTIQRKSKQYYFFLQNEKLDKIDFAEITVSNNSLSRTLESYFISGRE